MSEETDRSTRPGARQITILAFGDTAAELKMNALDEARAFFGDDPHLRMVPSYQAFDVRPGSVLAGRANGKKYYASVIVQVVESS